MKKRIELTIAIHCKTCHKRFRRVQDLRLHLEKTHGLTASESQQTAQRVLEQEALQRCLWNNENE